jgi:hypothetical protein
MRPVTSRLEVEIATTPTLNVAPMYAVGIPPSDIDAVWDKMRVDVGGMIIERDFDPGDVIVTGAPVGLLTESGDSLVTEAGDPIVTEVAL